MVFYLQADGKEIGGRDEMAGVKGRSGPKPVSINALIHDPVFKKDLIDRAIEAHQEVFSFALQMVKDPEGAAYAQEVYDVKTSEIRIIFIKPSWKDRVAAAKLLKEITIDKTVPDKRDAVGKGKEGEGHSLEKVLREIAAKKKDSKEKKVTGGPVLPVGDGAFVYPMDKKRAGMKPN